MQEGKERRRRKGEGIIIPSFLLFLIVFADAFVIGVVIIGLHGRMDEEFLRRSRKRRRRRRKNRGTFFFNHKWEEEEEEEEEEVWRRRWWWWWRMGR